MKRPSKSFGNLSIPNSHSSAQEDVSKSPVSKKRTRIRRAIEDKNKSQGIPLPLGTLPWGENVTVMDMYSGVEVTRYALKKMGYL